MTNSEIYEAIGLGGFPMKHLSVAEGDNAIQRALDWVKLGFPKQAIGTFDTVAGQQIYDLFGIGGPFEGGTQLIELFAPGAASGVSSTSLQLGFQGLYGSSNFNSHYPSDLILDEIDWNMWRRRFGSIDFQLLSGVDGGPILIVPTPQSVQTYTARYYTNRTEAEIRSEVPEWFLLVVEAYCALVLARKFSLSAGTRIGLNLDNGKTMQFWKEEAESLFLKATNEAPFVISNHDEALAQRS